MITLGDNLLEVMRARGRLSAASLRMLLPAPFPAMPLVLETLDALVAEGVVERLVEGEPRPLYWASSNPQVRPLAGRAPMRAPPQGTAAKVLDALVVPRTVNQIADHVGVTLPTVHAHLKDLLAAGLVVAPPEHTRGRPWRRADARPADDAPIPRDAAVAPWTPASVSTVIAGPAAVSADGVDAERRAGWIRALARLAPVLAPDLAAPLDDLRAYLHTETP